VDIAKLQRKRVTQEHLEKRFEEGNVDGTLQVQLEEDGSRLKTELDGVCGLCSTWNDKT